MSAALGNPLSGSRSRADSHITSGGPSPKPIEHWQHLIDEALETDPVEFGRKDFALLNLLCAPTLPGSENLDISRCLARLDGLTAFVKASTEQNLYRFPSDPDFGHSEPMADGAPHHAGQARLRRHLRP